MRLLKTLALIIIIPFNIIADNKSLKGAIDSVFQQHLAANEFLSGGAIGVYYKDSIYLEKGYGWANIEDQVHFDPNNTLIQTASVTKLITATAVLQLVESGQLDLDADVSNYLNSELIDNDFEASISIRHLLTHTAGIDDRSTLMYAKDKQSILSLEQYSNHYLPEVVWEPGKYFNYSNHAFNLLAYIVEKVSQKPFAEYIQENILNPLEMNSSGIGYNLSQMPQLMMRYNLKANDLDSTWVEEVPLSYTNIPGATDFKTTVHDMSNFIEMYLNHGSFKGKRLLDSATIANAFSTHFSYDESMHFQQGLGWRILNKNGIRLLYHEGDDKGIESAIYLYPDQKLGVFMIFNNQVGYQLKRELKELILSYFFPYESTDQEYEYSTITPINELTAKYYYMNDAQSNFEKVVYLFKDNFIEVHSVEDTLLIGPYKYLEFKPLIFDLLGDETGKASFIKDERGEVNYLSFGTSTYQKLTWWNQPELHKRFLLYSLLILLISTIASPFLKAVKNNQTQSSNRSKWILWNAIILLFFFAFFLGIMNFIKIGMEVPFLLKIALIFPLVAALMLPYSFYKGTIIFLSGIYHWAYRTVISIQILSMIIILLILFHYNMLGFNFY